MAQKGDGVERKSHVHESETGLGGRTEAVFVVRTDEEEGAARNRLMLAVDVVDAFTGLNPEDFGEIMAVHGTGIASTHLCAVHVVGLAGWHGLFPEQSVHGAMFLYRNLLF